jgi:hypothetical protein
MKIIQIEKKYEIEKKEMELLLLSQKEKQERIKKNIFIVILLLSLAIFSLILWSLLVKRKKNKIIRQREADLYQIEKEKNEIQKKKLQEEIEFKTRQLTTHTLNLMQKNKMLSNLLTEIDEIKKLPEKEIKTGLRKLKLEIKQNIRIDKDWETFKIQFEQVNKNFFPELIKINPKLNTYDLRHCAMVKLNLNIKESASVLNLSPHSIKSARYRLKKKLFLTAEDDLYDFLRNI